MRPNGVFKTENNYQKQLSREFYEKCPKAVLAAIAVSYAVNHANVPFESLTAQLLKEWEILNRNGIVPQKPTMKSVIEVECNECEFKGLKSELIHDDYEEEVDCCPKCNSENLYYFI